MSEKSVPYRPDRASNRAASAGLPTRTAWLAASPRRLDTSLFVKKESSAPGDRSPLCSVLPSSRSLWTYVFFERRFGGCFVEKEGN